MAQEHLASLISVENMDGALERNRTSDIFFRREALYPLSYQGGTVAVETTSASLAHRCGRLHARPVHPAAPVGSQHIETKKGRGSKATPLLCV